MKDRIQGRKTNIGGDGSGLNRRGEGLGTGPVGATGKEKNGEGWLDDRSPEEKAKAAAAAVANNMTDQLVAANYRRKNKKG